MVETVDNLKDRGDLEKADVSCSYVECLFFSCYFSHSNQHLLRATCQERTSTFSCLYLEQ